MVFFTFSSQVLPSQLPVGSLFISTCLSFSKKKKEKQQKKPHKTKEKGNKQTK